MTTTTTTNQLSTPRLRELAHRVIGARLGILHDPAAAYAEDVPALIAALQEVQRELAQTRRGIRIEERLRLK